MTPAGDSVTHAIAAAVKELGQLAKQLTNIGEVLRKNIASYWKIKDASHKRAVAAKIQKLSRAFADLSFLQYAMAHETSAAEFSAQIADTLEEYVNKVEQTLVLIKMEFPELIQSDELLNSLPALLAKKRVAAELTSLLDERIGTPARRYSRRPQLEDMDELLEFKSFMVLTHESTQIAKVMREHANSLSS